MMPHSVEAEKVLLGGLIIHPKQMETVAELELSPDHFYTKAHDVLFKNMLELYRQKGVIDIPLLTSFLNDNNALEQIGGIDYLAQITLNASTSSNILHYAGLVLEKAQLRKLISTSQEIVQDAQSSKEINEILDESEKRILDITRNRRSSDFRVGGVVAQEVVNHLKDLASGKVKNAGMTTGYTQLDRMTRGFQPGDLIILAARPSVGKTAFALNVAVEAAMRQKEKSVAIFSLEMPAEQLVTRMLAFRSLIPSHKLQTGEKMTTELWNILGASVIDLNRTQIFIDDSSMTRMSDIFSKCRKLKADNNLGMIVIDYIQLISSSTHSENRQQEVSLISRQLKALARELEVPVIALSQLSRGVTQRTDKRPLLSDLRESGAIEQDADIVMMLYRKDYENKDQEDPDPTGDQEVELIIAKHRNGPIGTVVFSFTPEINKFTTKMGFRE